MTLSFTARARPSMRKTPSVATGRALEPARPALLSTFSSRNRVLPARPAAIPVQSKAEMLHSPERSQPSIALPLQCKLAVEPASNPLEDEADQVAEQVTRIPEAQHRHERLQTKGLGGNEQGQFEAPPIVQEVLRTPGRPLDEGTRAFMEPRFGTGFAQVRLHTDGRAAESARALGAHAYTVGRDVVFAENQYAPNGERGRRLLAHELTHVTQQGNEQPGSLGGAAGSPILMREPDGQDGEKEMKPHRVEGTPFTIIPLEPARGDEAIYIFGYRLPFRAVRVTNENEVTPLPKLPRDWKDVPGIFHVRPDALPRLAGHVSGGAADLADQLPGLVNVEPAPPGQPPSTVPRFAVTVRSDGVGLDVLDNVLTSLHPDVVPGTPLRGKISEDNLRRNKLIDPSVAVGKRLFAAGTLSLRDPYPLHYVDPTQVSVEAHGTFNPKEKDDRLELATGSLRVNTLGIAGAKEDVQAFVELSRLNTALAPLGLDEKQANVLVHEIVLLVEAKVTEISKGGSLQDVIDGVESLGGGGTLRKSIEQTIASHIAPGTKPSVVQHAVDEIVKELAGPGFSLHGPIFFGIPIGYGSFRAETTRHLRAPLEGSGIGTPFPASLAIVGPAYIPPGVLSAPGTPALGATVARDFESLALSATIAARPYLDTGVIGAAGVATARLGFRVKGFDVVVEGGFRGQVPFVGGPAATSSNFLSGLNSLEQAQQEAQANYNENVKKTESGVFAPDLQPPEILPASRPDAEFYGSFRIVRKFK